MQNCLEKRRGWKGKGVQEEEEDLKVLSYGTALRLMDQIMLRLWQGTAYRHSCNQAAVRWLALSSFPDTLSGPHETILRDSMEKHLAPQGFLIGRSLMYGDNNNSTLGAHSIQKAVNTQASHGEEITRQ